MTTLLLSLAILLEVAGTLSLRAQTQSKNPWWSLGVILFYLLAFAALWQVLSAGMPIAVAYGIWTAAGIALVAVLARVIWKDPFNWIMSFGIVLIGAGVLLVELG